MLEFIIHQANVTVVFKELNRDLLKRDIIKKAFDSKNNIITEFPDLLLVVSPSTGGQATFSDNRLTVNLPVNNIGEAAGLLGQACEILIKAAEDMKTIAYGYNLNGSINNRNLNFHKHLLNVCYGGGKTLSQLLKTEIVAVAPRFSFYWQSALFNLALAPHDEKVGGIDFQCNIHFENAVPPATDEIKKQLLEHTAYLKEIMERILEVQN